MQGGQSNDQPRPGGHPPRFRSQFRGHFLVYMYVSAKLSTERSLGPRRGRLPTCMSASIVWRMSYLGEHVRAT